MLVCWLWHCALCAATAVALQMHEGVNAFNLVCLNNADTVCYTRDFVKSTNPIFMKFATDVRHQCEISLLRLRGQGLSLRSKTPYWKSCVIMAWTWFKVPSPNLAVRQIMSTEVILAWYISRVRTIPNKAPNNPIILAYPNTNTQYQYQYWCMMKHWIECKSKTVQVNILYILQYSHVLSRI